jgi:hypothetical protein
LYLGTICAWEPCVPGNHLYLGTICIWVFGYLGTGTLLPGTFFAETLFSGTFRRERFGRNVLAGTLWAFPAHAYGMRKAMIDSQVDQP